MPVLRTPDILYEITQLFTQCSQNLIFILDGIYGAIVRENILTRKLSFLR